MTANTQLEPLEMDYPHRDLEAASRVRGALPVSQPDLAELLDALAAAGVQPPAAAVRALRLLAEVDAYRYILSPSLIPVERSRMKDSAAGPSEWQRRYPGRIVDDSRWFSGGPAFL